MLSAGKVVICDRFCDSTTVYQGFTRGMSMELIRQLNDLLLAGLMPDITYLLDLPPAVGLRRAWNQISDGSRSKSETRFENEKLQFHEQVRKGYLELARRSPDRFVVVDASKDPLEVKKNILRHLEKMLHVPGGTVSA
jgi:dTMP kinase